MPEFTVTGVVLHFYLKWSNLPTLTKTCRHFSKAFTFTFDVVKYLHNSLVCAITFLSL